MSGPSNQYVEQCFDELRDAVEHGDTHLAAVTILDIADDYPEFAADILVGVLGQGLHHIADQIHEWQTSNA